MRLEIQYVNEFRYTEPARESHNLLRACPATTSTQRLVDYHLEVTPRAKITSFVDYWGTRVDAFGVREPHEVLRVVADSVVETAPPVAPNSDVDLGAYEAVAADLVTFLRPSPHTRWNEDVAAAARDAIDGHSTALSAIGAVADAVTSTLAYEPGSTYVGVDPAEVLDVGKGVCQDFAHLGIAMLRSVGIPSRYVSGYLYSATESQGTAPEEAEVDVQTHAWLEAFVPGHGWWALDPTNPQPIGELHVRIGHGRDYDDVMPLRGVYHGGAEHDLGVKVRITRERMGRLAEQ